MQKQLLPGFMRAVIWFSLLGACLVADAQQPDQTPAAEANARNLVVAAQRFYELKQYDRCLETATNASKLVPNDYRPWAILGFCYYGQGKLKSSSDALSRSVAINPRDRQVWYLKAYVDRSRNAPEEAIAASRKAIEIDPNFADAYELLGEALAFGDKDIPGAIEAYRHALVLRPDMAKASKELGEMLAYRGDKKEAEHVFRQAMERDPQKMACRFNLGSLLVEQGRLAEARELWNGRKFDQTDSYPLFIDILERAEKKKAAADRLAASPDDPDALLEMGFVELDGESWVVDMRQQRAIKYFQKALTQKPGLARAQYGITKAYIEIASMDKKVNADVDRELANLRKLDPKLADELTEYRKTYKTGLSLGATISDQ